MPLVVGVVLVTVVVVLGRTTLVVAVVHGIAAVAADQRSTGAAVSRLVVLGVLGVGLGLAGKQ